MNDEEKSLKFFHSKNKRVFISMVGERKMKAQNKTSKSKKKSKVVENIFKYIRFEKPLMIISMKE